MGSPGIFSRMNVPPSEMLVLPSGVATVEWRRSAQARRVSLRIDPRNGGIIVTLPPRASRRAGLALLNSHVDWITDRLRALPSAVPFADGAIIPIDGIPHRLRHAPEQRGLPRIEAGELIITGNTEFLRRRTQDFLRAEARRRLSALVAEKSEIAGLRAKRVTVKDTSSRWGSCAADGSLAFSWRLILAPVFVQDYVAAHEVGHLRHMDHGPKFWALVAELTPHMVQATPWLRVEAARLMRIG